MGIDRWLVGTFVAGIALASAGALASPLHEGSRAGHPAVTVVQFYGNPAVLDYRAPPPRSERRWGQDERDADYFRDRAIARERAREMARERDRMIRRAEREEWRAERRQDREERLDRWRGGDRFYYHYDENGY